MSTLIKAARQALEALEWNLPVIEDYGDKEQLNRQHRAITALRQAIEQAEKQEPVFWYRPVGEDGGYEGPLHNGVIEKVRKECGAWKPLYTTPQPQEFVCSTGLCHFTLTQTNVGIGERGMEAYEAAKKRGWVGVSDERLMEMPKQEPVAWVERWYGSGQEQGWWIWERHSLTHGQAVARIGTGPFAERLTSTIVEKHNASLFSTEPAKEPFAPDPHGSSGLTPPAAPVQEPVAKIVPCYTPSGKRVALNTEYQHLPIGTNLYTTPQPQREWVIFPTMLRKMWSGGEVQAWLDENVNKEKNA